MKRMLLYLLLILGGILIGFLIAFRWMPDHEDSLIPKKSHLISETQTESPPVEPELSVKHASPPPPSKQEVQPSTPPPPAQVPTVAAQPTPSGTSIPQSSPNPSSQPQTLGFGGVVNPLVGRSLGPQKLPFSIFSDQGDHFIPSGWMGDYGDLKFYDSETTHPAQGTKCIKVTYSGKTIGGQKWAGIYWQDPANNWGTAKDSGYNLTGARVVKFFARGEKGGEVVEFKAGGISSGDYPDSFKADAPPSVLTQEWREYQIDLSQVVYNNGDLSHVIGGFVFALNKDKNPNGAVFYLDWIRYE